MWRCGFMPSPLPLLLQVNDTVMLDLETGKVKDFVKFDVGNLCMVTGGHNNGRVGTIVHKEKHKVRRAARGEGGEGRGDAQGGKHKGRQERALQQGMLELVGAVRALPHQPCLLACPQPLRVCVWWRREGIGPGARARKHPGASLAAGARG